MLSINFEYPDIEEMATVFLMSDTDQWVGNGQDACSEQEALLEWKNLLVRRQDAQWPMTVMRVSGKVVGFALSVPCTDQRAQMAKLPPVNDYYKLGNFFIHPNFRGKGYGHRTAEWFLKQKKKIVYFVEDGNYISESIPKRLGLTHTHDFWISLAHSKSWVDKNPPMAYRETAKRYKCYRN